MWKHTYVKVEGTLHKSENKNAKKSFNMKIIDNGTNMNAFIMAIAYNLYTPNAVV